MTARFSGTGETVTGQIPAPGQSVPGGSQVMVYLGEGAPEKTVAVPDFAGMNRQQVVEQAGRLGLYVLVCGNDGISAAVVATGQSVKPGEQVPVGTTVAVTFADTQARD